MPTINWIEIIGAVAVILLVAFTTHHYDSAIYAVEKAAAIADQKTADNSECDNQKKITGGAQHALQANLDDVNTQLANLKRLHPSVCLTPIAGKANIIGAGARPAVRNGVDSDRLYEFAAKCKIYWKERIVLDKFIDDERKQKP